MHAYLIVVYNESVFESSTFKSLLRLLQERPHAAMVYLWDNSPKPQHQVSEFNLIKSCVIKYIYYGINEKLSTVYNKVIDSALADDCKFISILDQDSILPLDFKDKIDSIENPKLVVPTVYSSKSGLIISPRYQRYNYRTNSCIARPIDISKVEGSLASNEFFAVGSGMTISRILWESGVRFNESLSFYGVDTEFCNDYAKKFNSFNIIKCNFLHDASGENDEGFLKLKWRLSKYFEYWNFSLVEKLGWNVFLAKIYIMIFKIVLLAKSYVKKNLINKIRWL
ncbi:hypothetical protein RYR54_004314 [Aeromonas sobria]|nr:hypothetical protein [Aeromonas sobria]